MWIWLVVLTLSLTYSAFNWTVDFFKHNTIVRYQILSVKLHSPFEVISLEELKQREEQEKVIQDLTDKVIDEYFNPKEVLELNCKVDNEIDPKQFFNTLRQKESSMGTNKDITALHNYCSSKGLWNEIGYAPKQKYCFKDIKEAQLYVAYYVKKNCDGKTQAECECYWNTGSMSKSCAYSENRLSEAN